MDLSKIGLDVWRVAVTLLLTLYWIELIGIRKKFRDIWRSQTTIFKNLTRLNQKIK